MEARRNRRKTLTNPSELVVLTKCLDLVKYTFTVSSNDKNIAKKYHLTMVRQIQDVVLSAYSCPIIIKIPDLLLLVFQLDFSLPKYLQCSI